MPASSNTVPARLGVSALTSLPSAHGVCSMDHKPYGTFAHAPRDPANPAQDPARFQPRWSSEPLIAPDKPPLFRFHTHHGHQFGDRGYSFGPASEAPSALDKLLDKWLPSGSAQVCTRAGHQKR